MFRFNGPLYRFCMWIARLVALNVMFIVSCVLIITIFPAMAATSAIASAWVRGQNPPLFRQYWFEFRTHLKNSLILGSIFMLVLALLAVDYRAIVLRPTAFHWLWALIVIVSFLLVITTAYTYGLISRFELGWKPLILMAFRLAAYQVHITLLQVFTIIAICVLAFKSTFIDAFFTFSGIAYVNAWYVEYKLRIISNRAKEKESIHLANEKTDTTHLSSLLHH